jgi:hypothetical protein
MVLRNRPLDVSGRLLRRGDEVTVKRIPESLVRGLPNGDQRAINSCVGQSFKISGFNGQGEAEIEFTDASNEFHTIWIETSCLEKG